MANYFGCCKAKECLYFCCIQCHGVFHLSCMGRKKNVTKAGDHKVICSSECERRKKQEDDRLDRLSEELINLRNERLTILERIEENESDRIKDLVGEVGRLYAEIGEKDMFIQRLEKRRRDFEQEAVASEQSFMKKMEEQKKIIAELNKELVLLGRKNNDLECRIGEVEAARLRLQGEIVGMNEMRTSMLTSIETLTAESEFYLSELKRCKNSAFLLEDGQDKSVQTEADDKGNLGNGIAGKRKYVGLVDGGGIGVDVSLAKRAGADDRSRIVLLSDDIGRGLCKAIMDKVDLNRYRVESIFKPGATFDQVIDSLDSLSGALTIRDHIFVIAGSNDFSTGSKYPSFRNICQRLKSCYSVNVTIATIPYRVNSSVNKFIYKFNNKLVDVIGRINNCVQGTVGVLDVNNGGSFLHLGRQKIPGEVIKIVLQARLPKNLIFISPDGVCKGNISDVHGGCGVQQSTLHKYVHVGMRSSEDTHVHDISISSDELNSQVVRSDNSLENNFLFTAVSHQTLM